MLHVAVRMLRYRKRTFVAALIALVFGAMIVMACGGLMETGIRHAVPAQRLAAAPIVVTGDQSYDGAALPERARIDIDLVATLSRLPGVARAVPDSSFPVAVAGRGVRAAGHSWTSAQLGPYALTGGHPPTGPDQVVLEQHLAAQARAGAGDRVALAVRGGTESFTVVGVASAPPRAPGGLFFSDATTARLLGAPGKTDAIGVLVRPGTDVGALRARIDRDLSGVRVLTGDQRGMAEFPAAQSDAAALISLAGVFGGLAVMAAVFVVASTLGLLVQLRLREMALLTAVGATTRQLRRMVIAETLLVGVLATALAYVPGRRLGRWLLRQFADGGAVSPGIAFHQGWIPAGAGAGVALLTALAAAVVAARRATRVRPVEALTEAAVPRRWLSGWRLAFAGLLLAGGIAVSVVTGTVMSGPIAESTAIPAAMLWAGGLALLGPGLTRALVAVLQWPVRAVTGLAGELGARNAGAHKVRLASAVTSVMLAAGLATALVYMQTGQTSAGRHAYTDDLRADAVLTSAGGGMSPSLVDAVAAAPGVAGASALVTSTGYFELTAAQERHRESNDEPDDLPLRGVSGGVISARAVDGSFAALTGNAIALPANLASAPGRHVGDSVRLRLGDGASVQVRVVAAFDARHGYPSAFVPASLLLAHSTTGLVPQILLRAAPGTSVSDLAAAVRPLAHGGSPLHVAGRGALATAAEDREHAWVDYLLAAAIVGYAVIALVNTLVIATTERRREFALQRLIGSTRSQLVRMMTVESVLVAAAGLVLGAAVATAALVPFSIALTGSLLPDGPVWIGLAVIGSATVLTAAAVLVSTAAALRTAPIRTSTA